MIEALGGAGGVLLDKTGTLTSARPGAPSRRPAGAPRRRSCAAATVEQLSAHVLARRSCARRVARASTCRSPSESWSGPARRRGARRGRAACRRAAPAGCASTAATRGGPAGPARATGARRPRGGRGAPPARRDRRLACADASGLVARLPRRHRRSRSSPGSTPARRPSGGARRGRQVYAGLSPEDKLGSSGASGDGPAAGRDGGQQDQRRAGLGDGRRGNRDGVGGGHARRRRPRTS